MFGGQKSRVQKAGSLSRNREGGLVAPFDIKSNFTVFAALACMAALQGEPFKCAEVS
jgi:hypothetical protein